MPFWQTAESSRPRDGSSAWEHALAGALHRLRLDSIKARIILLCVFATLVPSFSMGSLAYRTMTQYLDSDVEKQLQGGTAQMARELELWVKERRYELRVFASSYEVSENVDALLRNSAAAVRERAHRRLKDYLQSVRNKFPDYEEILVESRAGTPVASTAREPGEVSLPPRWQKRVEADTTVVGAPYDDKALHARVVTMAVPVKRPDGAVLGYLVAKPNLRTIVELLKGFRLADRGHLYVVDADGSVVASSRWEAQEFKAQHLPAATVQLLSERVHPFDAYDDPDGIPVLGSMQWLSQLDWGVVAEIGVVRAYEKAIQLRKMTAFMVVVLLIATGLISYVVGQTIVGPVVRLSTAAAGVAEGNFGAILPQMVYGEVGYLTVVFNTMVDRLRQAQEALERTNRTLSQQNRSLESVATTDTLTGLYNRRYLMEKMADEMTRCLRLDHPFSILMLDLDYFKKYNDTYGHPAGDQLLRKVARIFRDSLRKIDVAARYGGEEFVIMLPELDTNHGVMAAERIRNRVAAELYGDGGPDATVTVSIGVAGYPDHGDTAETLIASADAALYEAKRRGRNRVVLAGSPLAEPERHAQLR